MYINLCFRMAKLAWLPLRYGVYPRSMVSQDRSMRDRDIDGMGNHSIWGDCHGRTNKLFLVLNY